MLAATLPTHFNFASEEGLGKGFSLAMPKLCQFSGTCKTHGAGNGAVHRGGGRTGSFRVGEDMEIGEGVAFKKRARSFKILFGLAGEPGDDVRPQREVCPQPFPRRRAKPFRPRNLIRSIHPLQNPITAALE